MNFHRYHQLLKGLRDGNTELNLKLAELNGVITWHPPAPLVATSPSSAFSAPKPHVLLKFAQQPSDTGVHYLLRGVGPNGKHSYFILIEFLFRKPKSWTKG